ncbi:helix-turn-helix transcriptional regulator [Butyricimonas paravirosa]|uniref:helix-turn-helix domain-containing protein n=1 Tax=Butyricimonas paravirosa TaxID=1472417 RepID=UPI002A81F2F1|nr:helix-turn-helix transcriptional regulator [Butyricimonas paravirosa]
MKSAIEWYIVQEVKKRRKANKWSQQYLADCMNISRGYLKNIESPKSIASYNVDRINDIAKIFGISPRELWPEKPL